MIHAYSTGMKAIKFIAVGTVLTWAVAGIGQMAHAYSVPNELRATVPSATLNGSGRLRVFGFQVYDAALWTAPGFRADDFTQHAFALELSYLRDFSGQDIAKRSVDEMRRLGNFSDAQAEAWQRAMQAAFPDVKKGDRITGVHQPGVGAQFLTNGKLTGEVRDTQFARLFFGIWLSPNTSQPQLRQALLTRAAN
jgi:Chalcone isomerase-like